MAFWKDCPEPAASSDLVEEQLRAALQRSIEIAEAERAVALVEQLIEAKVVSGDNVPQLIERLAFWSVVGTDHFMLRFDLLPPIRLKASALLCVHVGVRDRMVVDELWESEYKERYGNEPQKRRQNLRQ